MTTPDAATWPTNREQRWNELITRAHHAGLTAFLTAPAGIPPCGYASVQIKPATSAFARWLIRSGHAEPAWNGGITLTIHVRPAQAPNLDPAEVTQSLNRNAAYAHAFAAILHTAGIPAHPHAWLD